MTVTDYFPPSKSGKRDFAKWLFSCKVNELLWRSRLSEKRERTTKHSRNKEIIGLPIPHESKTLFHGTQSNHCASLLFFFYFFRDFIIFPPSSEIVRKITLIRSLRRAPRSQRSPWAEWRMRRMDGEGGEARGRGWGTRTNARRMEHWSWQIFLQSLETACHHRHVEIGRFVLITELTQK